MPFHFCGIAWTLHSLPDQEILELGTNAFTLISFFRLSHSRDVVAVLHAHERVHGNAKGLLEAQRHSGDKLTCAFNSAESAYRVTLRASAAPVTERRIASIIS